MAAPSKIDQNIHFGSICHAHYSGEVRFSPQLKATPKGQKSQTGHLGDRLQNRSKYAPW